MLKLGKRRQREDYSFGERQREKHTGTRETSLGGRATQGRRIPQGSRGACILPRQLRLLEVYGIRNTLLTLI